MRKKRIKLRAFPVIIRIFLLPGIIFSYCNLHAQHFDWPSIVFKDSSNFRMLRAFGDKFPTQYILLSKSTAWNGRRFRLKEDLLDSSIKSKLKRNEHHPYNTQYIFRHPDLDSLVSTGEKKYLFDEAIAQKPADITGSTKNYRLTSSFEKAPYGFLFAATAPVFSSDNFTAYIDLTVFRKTNESTGPNDSYFGTILLMYKYSAITKEWLLFKQIPYLIL